MECFNIPVFNCRWKTDISQRTLQTNQYNLKFMNQNPKRARNIEDFYSWSSSAGAFQLFIVCYYLAFIPLLISLYPLALNGQQSNCLAGNILGVTDHSNIYIRYDIEQKKHIFSCLTDLFMKFRTHLDMFEMTSVKFLLVNKWRENLRWRIS